MGRASDVNRLALEAFKQTDLVLDALPRAVVVTDDAGIIVAWNRIAEEVFGWPASAVLGSPGREVVLVAGGPDVNDTVLASVLAGSVWRGDLDVLRRDGTLIRLFSIVSPLRDEHGRVVGMVSASDDVTHTRQVQRRAADLTAHLQLALEAGDLGTWRWDMTAGITWDERLERLFGLAPGSFDGRFETYLSCIHPEDREHTLAVVNEAVERKSGYTIDHRVVWPDGSVHWLQGRGRVMLDEYGRVTGTIGCTGDITETKMAEAAAHRRAAQAAAAVERERQRRERLEFLTGLTDASIRAFDHDEYMRLVTTAAVPRLGDWCSLLFVPEQGAALEVEVAHSDPAKTAWAKELSERYPFDPSAARGVAQVIRSGEPEFLPHVDEAVIEEALRHSSIDRDEALAILEQLAPTSVITVPLKVKRGVIGAMQFVTAESGRHYDDEDLALAQVAAGRIAEALQNMWLADQHRDISAALQQSLLPPAVPAVPGLDVAVRYWPAGAVSEVGGDFYDLFRLDDRRWAVVIGDVCGTGPNAAALTGIVRHTVRAAARHGHGHTEVHEWINEAVLHSDRDLFCTCCYATIESVDGGFVLRSSSAGHPFPIVVSADGVATTLGRPGTLLGVFDEITTHVCETLISPGDAVVFYTDGVTDLPPPHGLDVTETSRLVAEAVRSGDAGATADAIHASLVQRLPTSRRQDDIALVALRVV